MCRSAISLRTLRRMQIPPPRKRENRLYQADWLIRLYGFSIDEVITEKAPNLDLTMDPKQAFALRHPTLFPVDVNTADREMILRVPGIGIKSANRIVSLRRRGRIRFEHLKQMGVVVSRALPFIDCDGLPATSWRVPATASEKCQPFSLAPLVFVTDGSFDGMPEKRFASSYGSATIRRSTFQNVTIPGCTAACRHGGTGNFQPKKNKVKNCLPPLLHFFVFPGDNQQGCIKMKSKTFTSSSGFR